MNSELAQLVIIIIQVLLGTVGNLCPPEMLNSSVEAVVRESPKESISCILKAVSGTDLPQNKYSHSPLPTEPYYVGTASTASTASPSPSIAITTG